MRSASALGKFHKEYGKKAVFYVVYIREAHPSDGRRPRPGNPKDPTNNIEREVLASKCIKSMKLEIPVVIDDIKDVANKAYGAWPDRIYIVDTEGKITYKAGRGPRGFKPDEAKKALKELLEKKKDKEEKDK